MKQNKISIVVTGGIASGKSQVSNYLRKQNYKVIDADEISRLVVEPGSQGLELLKNHFSDKIIKNGSLDREKLGEIIFNNPKDRKVLNDILHPLIFEQMKFEANKVKDDLIFYDIPLYFEIKESIDKSDFSIKEVWLVYTSLEKRLERLMKRDSIGFEFAMKKIESQMPLEEKVKESDRVFFNENDLHYLFNQLDEALLSINIGGNQ